MNPATEQAKQDHLDVLYEADGRGNPEHPQCGLYTGLAQAERRHKKQEQRSAELLEMFLAWWKDSYGTPVGKHAQMTHVAFAEFVETTAFSRGGLRL